MRTWGGLIFFFLIIRSFKKLIHKQSKIGGGDKGKVLNSLKPPLTKRGCYPVPSKTIESSL